MPKSAAATRCTVRPRAPDSRVYSSDPVQRQSYFPSRRRIAVPSLRMRRSRLPGKTESQQTMTQIGFVQSFSSNDGMEDAIPINGAEEDNSEDEVRWIPNKRRRFRKSETGTAETGYQSTLTQARFFVSDSAGEDEDEFSESMESQPHASCFDGGNDEHMEDVENLPTSTAPENQNVFDPKTHNLQSVQPHTRPSVTRPSSFNQTRPVFKMPLTPHRTIKREIPSSQSPADTPLSMHGTPSQRTPLVELTKNSIKSRDVSPSFRVSQSAKARKSIDYELDENNDENWDPCSNIAKPMSSKRKRRPSSDEEPRSPDIQNEAFSNYEYPQQLQLDFSSPSTHDRGRSSRDSPQQSSPQAPIRSSQATTVDITQHSPITWSRSVKQEPASNFEIFDEEGGAHSVQHAFDAATNSGHTRNEGLNNSSQFRFEYPPNTQDGITVSQLLPASLLRDMSGES